MTEYVVLGVQAYSIPDEKTGDKVEGISIYYLDLAEEYKFDKTDPKEAVGGFLSGKLTARLEDLRYFSTLPGVYDIDTKMRRTSKGSVAKFVNAKLVKPMDLASLSTGIEQIENRVDDVLDDVAELLPSASEGKITKEQVPKVKSKLKDALRNKAAKSATGGIANVNPKVPS